jgi:hypothetical protein
VEFCYAKHGHPNVNKGNSSHHESNGSRSANSVAEEGSSSTNTGLSQVQYDQLVSLLQQANLFASAQSPSNPPSNNASVSNVIHDGLSPHDSSTSGNHSLLNSIFTPSYWILDSGANEHICSSPHWFYSLHSIDPINVSLPNGASISVKTAGTIHLTDKISLHNVLYSPNFTINLISISKICQSLKCCVHFVSNKCIIQDTTSQKMIGLGDRINGLYRLIIPKSNISSAAKHHTIFSHSVSNNNHVTSCNFNSTIIHVSALWHFRFGLLSNSRLSDMIHLYPNISVDNKVVCDVCHFAKQRTLPFNTSHSIAKTNFELLHFDIWGPLSTASIHGHRYFLTILDDHSRFVWIVLLKSKASVSSHVQNFITLIENQFHITPKIIRSDNGPEFFLTYFFAQKGIVHQKSCVETPQQNGRVERKHQHILNVGRALLFQSKLPKHFWSYALLHATFLINRVSTHLLHNQSPYQVLYNQTPDISQFKVFGSLCFASTLTSHRSKLDSRARKAIFLGYPPGMKGYVLYDLHSHHIFVSRHVTFYDHILPYSANASNPTHQWTYVSHSPPPSSTNIDDVDSPLPSLTSSSPNPDTITTSTNITSPTIPPPSSSPRKSTRPKTTPSHLKDYVCSTFIDTSTPSSGNPHSISNFVSYTNLSSSQCRFFLFLHIMNPSLLLKLTSLNVGNKLCKLSFLLLNELVLGRLLISLECYSYWL